MALGAQRGDILGLLVKQGMRLVMVGAFIGVAAAAASSRILESFLYGVTMDDRLTFVAAPLVLVAVRWSRAGCPHGEQPASIR